MSRDYIQDPEVALALAYVPADRRATAETLFALDAQMGNVVRTTSEPMLGAMRLTWWRDAVEALVQDNAPDEPLLQRLWLNVQGESRMRLAMMAEGWMALLDPMPIAREVLDDFGRLRGGVLFTELGSLLGAADLGPVEMAGKGWALVDFAFRCSDRETAETALDLARMSLQKALERRWPVEVRSLGMLAHLAKRDAAAGIGYPRRQGSPLRVFSALRHRVTGR